MAKMHLKSSSGLWVREEAHRRRKRLTDNLLTSEKWIQIYTTIMICP